LALTAEPLASPFWPVVSCQTTTTWPLASVALDWLVGAFWVAASIRKGEDSLTAISWLMT
jgi:hypothetical protein